jgi:hypothetical protein
VQRIDVVRLARQQRLQLRVRSRQAPGGKRLAGGTQRLARTGVVSRAHGVNVIRE